VKQQFSTLANNEQKAKEQHLLSWLQTCGVPVTPYSEGHLRIDPETTFIPSRRMKTLRKATNSLSVAYDELCLILTQEKTYLKEFFLFSSIQEALWYSSGGQWQGIARADIFFTQDGRIAIAELNSDTPSGLDEAYLLSQYAEELTPGYINPNRNLPKIFTSIITQAFKEVQNPSSTPTVGIIYPTDIPEDMGLLFLYQHWLQQAGYRIVLGSPWNIRKNTTGGLTLFGKEIDVLLRHYKTDWWCERKNIWKDSRPIPDSEPLLSLLRDIINSAIKGKLAIVNPFGTIVTQNKLSLAFFHENLHLFTQETQENILHYIPLTKRLSQFDPILVLEEKDSWVLKSDYGCEGAEVIIGKLTPRDEWKRILRLAIPERWIVQQYFEAEKTENGMTENYGVYLIHGRSQGAYLRLSQGVTSTTSSISPVLERPLLSKTAVHQQGSSSSNIPCHPQTFDLLNVYQPSHRWLPFRMPLIAYSPIFSKIDIVFPPSNEIENVFHSASKLKTIIEKNESFACTCLIICDLPGPHSVAVAAVLSSVADIVLQMENIAHTDEIVPLHKSFGALLYFAPTVQQSRAQLSDGNKYPPFFILDRRRMKPLVDPSSYFNNRHWANLPSINTLRENGIHSILYIHPENESLETDDLNEDFIQYSQAGIHISKISLQQIDPYLETEFSYLLSENKYLPLRRETVFSYLLPTPYQDHKENSSIAEREFV
jgi:glutathionylspermidine synthase